MPRGFSRRIARDLASNRLSGALARRRAAGGRVDDLTGSNPTKVGLPALSDACRRIPAALEAALSLPYDPDPRGSLAAREAIASLYRARMAGGARGAGGAPGPGTAHPAAEDLFLAASTSEAYSWLFKLLCDPGDEILVPRPSYPLLEHLAALECIELRTWPLREEGEWSVDLPALESAVTPRTRALVVVNPNNPTGSFLRGAEAAAIGSLCASRGIALISDEVFADYAIVPRADAVRSLGADPADRGERAGLTFLLDGLSKTLALPQMKLSWIAVLGPRNLRDEAMERLELIADSYLSVSSPVQLALPSLLEARPLVQGAILARLRENLAAARGLIGPRSACRLLPVEAGWSAVVQIPAVRTEEDWCLALLEEEGVLVHPGYFFDFESEAFLVLSLLAEPGLFARGVEKLVGLVGRGPAAARPAR